MITLGSLSGVPIQTPLQPQTQDQTRPRFLPQLIRDSLYCPPRLMQLQLSVVGESTANVSDRFFPLSWSTHHRLVFTYWIWCGLLTGVGYIPCILHASRIHAHLEGLGCR
jgi:hypothetical protein